ncbi:hypothetical protein [Salinibacterium sp. ZJ454]|uniref:hypothetical protein n=1 Tax=Salinibacterium sp. ZJ454 TaxID=2708339 RepID=UPI00141F0F87|nr:hypothetical protein [Salinibacterium sp. ZJ454]
MDIFSALITALGTVGVLAVAGTVTAVIVIARRSRFKAPRPSVAGAPERESIRSLELDAGSALVRVDDLIHDAEDELGFALAQFGERETRDFAQAIGEAKRDVREAFALKQRLDDAVPDTDRQQRDWNRRILVLCAAAEAALGEHERDFEARRRRESSAPADLERVRDRITATRARLEALGAGPDAVPDAGAVPDVAGPRFAQVERLLAEADDTANRAEGLLGGREPVSPLIWQAERNATAADRALDAIQRAEQDARRATAELGTFIARARDNLSEAKLERDRNPDPDQRDSVNAAIAEVEDELAAVDHNEARASIDRLHRAVDRLDTALAGARSAERRLAQARDALDGALHQAVSRIAAATDFIAAHRGRVGPDARTRLAEAERQLDLARAEADPVAALDAARRASTRAIDADALARYDALHR